MDMDIVAKTQKRVEISKKKLAKTIELKTYRKLAVNFLILTINLIVIILYFSLSQAKIVIIPAKEDITHNISLPIKEESAQNDKELSVAGNIISAEVEHTQTFTVSSTSSIDQNASGAITIYNKTANRKQTFVKETRFKNDKGIEIKIQRQVQIQPGGQIDVEAYASQKGPSGEIGKESGRFQVVALPHLKDQIYGEVSKNFTGGTKEIKLLTPTAFNDARDVVKDELRNKALNIISESGAAEIKKDDLAVEITDLKSTANPSDENVNDFTLAAKANVSAFTYDEDMAKEIVKQELLKKITPDKILATFKDEPSVSVNKDTLQITASASATIQQKIPEAALNQKDIVGMNEDEVREHFVKITGIRDVQIEFWPFWVRSVPNLNDHVDIEIKK